jgi:uncharacterized lipoprotein YajG
MRELEKPMKLVTLLSMTVLLVGCATTMGIGGINANPEAANPTAVCHVWKPVSWSSKDTDQTITEVKANNAARKAWGCPR